MKKPSRKKDSDLQRKNFNEAAMKNDTTKNATRENILFHGLGILIKKRQQQLPRREKLHEQIKT